MVNERLDTAGAFWHLQQRKQLFTRRVVGWSMWEKYFPFSLLRSADRLSKFSPPSRRSEFKLLKMKDVLPLYRFQSRIRLSAMLVHMGLRASGICGTVGPED
jgi:hypothetical protein